MSFWIIIGILTFIAALAVLLPLVRGKSEIVSNQERDRLVYEARLEEIDRDLSLDRISKEEAENAKAEEARRLIRVSSEENKGAGTRIGEKGLKSLLVIILVVVPVVSLGIYTNFGSPDYADQRIADRKPKTNVDASLKKLLEQAETHLDQNPDDIRGWQVVAPVYLRVGQYDKAVTANKNIIRLEGENPENLTTLAEALGYQAQGAITAEAVYTIDKALELDPKYPRARILKAFSLQQANQLVQAKEAWQSLITDHQNNPKDSQMVELSRQQLAEVENKLSGNSNGDSDGNSNAPAMAEQSEQENQPGNPTAEQIQDAAKMDADSRMEMIAGMISQLREKLKENPKNKAGWRRVFRSYEVLGKPEELKESIAEARAAFSDDAEFLSEIDAVEAKMK